MISTLGATGNEIFWQFKFDRPPQDLVFEIAAFGNDNGAGNSVQKDPVGVGNLVGTFNKDSAIFIKQIELSGCSNET